MLARKVELFLVFIGGKLGCKRRASELAMGNEWSFTPRRVTRVEN